MFELPESAQEVFDKVATHLLTQNKRCVTKISTCKYRFDGMSCAAGCLIPDHCYDVDMEGETWLSLVLQDKVPKEHKELIRDLQCIHDNYEVEEWRRKLRAVAFRFGLSAEKILN